MRERSLAAKLETGTNASWHRSVVINAHTHLHVLARYVSGAFVVPVSALIQAVHLHALKVGVIFVTLRFLRRDTLRHGLFRVSSLTRVHHARVHLPQPERERRCGCAACTVQPKRHERKRKSTQLAGKKEDEHLVLNNCMVLGEEEVASYV